MNSRIGKYSASIGLVPTSRLELLRLFRPLAPQASVSTNFTTWANFELSPKRSLRYGAVFPAFGGRRGVLFIGAFFVLLVVFFRCGRRGLLLRRRAVDHAAR